MAEVTTRPRVRFAPSPTGYLHVGGARTALFNWLFARRHHGVFILRIEDTDADRSSWDMVAGIVDGLRWLGLDWDEGPDIGGPHAPYFQSQRLDRYRAMADRLVREGHAYYCYCSAEALKERRDASQTTGIAWKYDRRCCELGADQIAELETTGAPRAIRFKVPEGTTYFDDLVHGRIEFDRANLEDFVILRSDRHPTYHLSVVVDDVEMQVTHIVRGDDHISNTPKQVLLYEALGIDLPHFAHVPLILGPDRKRLSKRHGATSVLEYKHLGYLPEAMVNFLALLGWSPGTDLEVFDTAELVEQFSLAGISGGNAVFNPEKLDWFNAQHIARLASGEIARRIEPELRAAGLWNDDVLGSGRSWLLRVIELLKPRARKLTDLVESGRPFFGHAVTYDPDAVATHLGDPGLASHLDALRDRFATMTEFAAPAIEATLRKVAEERGVKAAPLIHATRVAALGRAVSPSLFDVLELLGREKTVQRLGVAARIARGDAAGDRF
ncbi:MAG: glutamate--tRNA ligase [Acidobacteria bacterium]|nr:glutamate--tRNA ligase [Acidobacteriota bacterium]